MEKFKIAKIVEFTETETWGFLKEFFQEKEIWVLSYMRGLDLENKEHRKKFKSMNTELDAFKSFLIEIESLKREFENEDEIERYNQDIEDSILPTPKEKLDSE